MRVAWWRLTESGVCVGLCAAVGTSIEYKGKRGSRQCDKVNRQYALSERRVTQVWQQVPASSVGEGKRAEGQCVSPGRLHTGADPQFPITWHEMFYTQSTIICIAAGGRGQDTYEWTWMTKADTHYVKVGKRPITCVPTTLILSFCTACDPRLQVVCHNYCTPMVRTHVHGGTYRCTQARRLAADSKHNYACPRLHICSTPHQVSLCPPAG